MLKNHLLQKRLLAYSAAAGIALTGGVALADTNEINVVVINDISDETIQEDDSPLFANINPLDNATNEMKLELSRSADNKLKLVVTPVASGTDILSLYCGETGPSDNKPYEPGEFIPGSGSHHCTSLTGTYAISFFLSDIGTVNNGSIGVRFNIGGSQHWGWIRFSSTANSVTIEGYGYETDSSQTSITAPGGGPLAVTLANFAALADGTDVSVRWSTVSEQDNFGFNVYRSTDSADLGEQLNAALIPAQAPGSGQGSSYDFLDQDLEAGVTYYYTLEDVDANGTPTHHGPVSVTVNTPTAVTVGQLATQDSMPNPSGLLVAGGALAAVALAAQRRRQKK